MVALAVSAAAPARGEAGGAAQRLLVLGDSLTAGYGVAAADAFPAQLERALEARGRDVRVINAGVSGDTTAGGLARLDWALAEDPRYAIVALGANDALRGVDPAETARNLSRIVERLKRRKIAVLLAGMYAPRNLGREYSEAFDALYPRLAQEYDVPLYPFFLDGVATVPEYNQQDGMHPNRQGVAIMVERILPYVTVLLGGAGG